MDFIKAFQRMNADDLREQVINLLKEAYSDGRITVESLERRLQEATTAKSKDELLALVADIPSPASSEEESGTGTSYSRPDRTWTVNNGVPRSNQTLFAVLGASERRGNWQPAREITCFSLMGGIILDFREAEFPRQGITVNAGCIMGSVEIIVPPGINVDLSGIPLLGGMDNKAGSGDADAPQVSVKGVAIMGAVEVKRKETKAAKDARKGKRGRRSDRRRAM